MKQLINRELGIKTTFESKRLDDSISHFLVKVKEYLLQYLNMNVRMIQAITSLIPL